ncbi:hypothetical protein Bca4012_026304 [Brassica carinata]
MFYEGIKRTCNTHIIIFSLITRKMDRSYRDLEERKSRAKDLEKLYMDMLMQKKLKVLGSSRLIPCNLSQTIGMSIVVACTPFPMIMPPVPNVMVRFFEFGSLPPVIVSHLLLPSMSICNHLRVHHVSRTHQSSTSQRL